MGWTMSNWLGNLLNRTLGLLKKNCNATIPVDSSCVDDDNVIKKVAAESVSLSPFCISCSVSRDSELCNLRGKAIFGSTASLVSLCLTWSSVHSLTGKSRKRGLREFAVFWSLRGFTGHRISGESVFG